MTSDTNEKPTTEERYTTAISQSNMRMDLKRRSPADIIVAAACHPYEIGRLLQRLKGEWDGQSLKGPADAEAIERIASEYKREPAGSPNAGMVRQDVRDVKTGNVIGVEYVLPLVLAAKHAAEWRAHEMGLVFQRLKTLPEVRAALVQWMETENAVYVVSAVLQWWLNPKCLKCEGRMFKVAAGTGRTTGRACHDCSRPGREPGKAKVPHSWEGRRILSFMEQCVAEAAKATAAKNR